MRGYKGGKEGRGGRDNERGKGRKGVRDEGMLCSRDDEGAGRGRWQSKGGGGGGRRDDG